MVFPLVFSKYTGLWKELRLFFLLRIPALELYVLACLRRREMGGKCPHPSPPLSFGYFISANKGVVLFIFFLRARALLYKYVCLLHKQHYINNNETEKEIFTYGLTTLTHQLCFYFSRSFPSFSYNRPI